MPTLHDTPVPRQTRLCGAMHNTAVTVVVPPPPSRSGTVLATTPMTEVLLPSSGYPFLPSFLLNIRKAKQMFLTNYGK